MSRRHRFDVSPMAPNGPADPPVYVCSWRTTDCFLADGDFSSFDPLPKPVSESCGAWNIEFGPSTVGR